MVRAIAEYGFAAGAKAVMGMLGIDCGPCRPPLRDLTEAEYETLCQQLVALEVLAGPVQEEVPVP
jgi:dihydrodipicolinate synthase/N-acetylneuraminate lyase